MYPDYRYPL
jgi:hypothetical protein